MFDNSSKRNERFPCHQSCQPLLKIITKTQNFPGRPSSQLSFVRQYRSLLIPLLQTQDYQVHWILLIVSLSPATWLPCFKLSSRRDQQVCFRETEALAAQLPCTLLEPQHWLTTRQDEAQSKRGKYLLWVAACLAWAAHHFLKFYHLSRLVFLKVTNQL